MVQDVLSLNWDLFEKINEHAGHQTLLDPTMIFTASYLIFLLPVLLLVLWFALAHWSPLIQRNDQTDDARLEGHVTLLAVVLGAAIALGVNILVGNLLFEPRPFVSHPAIVHKLIPYTADASFPSDHLAISFAIVTVLFALAAALSQRGVAGGLAIFVTLLALLAAVAIGFARVYVGVHYPGDILGGALCGVVGGLVALALRRVLRPLLTPVIDLLGQIGLA
jgi:undecaprenyl-diphosphatase